MFYTRTIQHWGPLWLEWTFSSMQIGGHTRVIKGANLRATHQNKITVNCTSLLQTIHITYMTDFSITYHTIIVISMDRLPKNQSDYQQLTIKFRIIYKNTWLGSPKNRQQVFLCASSIVGPYASVWINEWLVLTYRVRVSKDYICFGIRPCNPFL